MMLMLILILMILLSQQVCGNYLQDPAFTKPNIPSGKYKYIQNECFSGGWCYNNAVVIDGETIWNYPIPFPGPGDQIACIQGLRYFYQKDIYLPAGRYKLTWETVGRGYKQVVADDWTEHRKALRV